MSPYVLSIMAVAQAIFIVVLILTLGIARTHRTRHRARVELETAELMSSANHWLASPGRRAGFREMVDRAGFVPVVEMLQRLGSHVGGRAWGELVSELRRSEWFEGVGRRATSPFWWRRLSATHALAMVAEPEDTALLEVLLYDPNPVIRLATVPTLRRVNSPRLVEATLEVAAGAQSVVRRYLLETLTLCPGLDLSLIELKLRDATEPEDLQLLLELVAQLGTPGFLGRVLPHVDHPNLEVRVAVARTLAQFPHTRSAAALSTLLDDPEWQVRAQAAAGLGIVRAEEMASSLAQALRDPSWWVRLRAGLTLRRLGAPGIDILGQTDPDEDRFAFEMAQYVLGLDEAAVAEYGGPSAADYTEVVPASRAA